MAPALVGFWRANGSLDHRVWLVLLLLATCSAVAEVANHFADYEQDKAQKEKRLGPILLAGGSFAGGELFTSVKAISAFLGVAGTIYFVTAITLTRNPGYHLVAVLAFLMAAFYSMKPIRLKERGFWGTFSIAIGRGLISFHLGWLVVNEATAYSILAGLIISLLVFGSAMMAHLQDYEEDKAMGIMTFPVRIGANRSMWIAAITFLASLVLATVFSSVANREGFWCPWLLATLYTDFLILAYGFMNSGKVSIGGLQTVGLVTVITIPFMFL